jgi:hypothetical protein
LLCWDFPCAQIMLSSLISIGVHSGWRNFNKLQQLIIKVTPCLERLLFLGGTKIDVLVIPVPRLPILGKLHNNNFPRFHSGTTTIQVWALSRVRIVTVASIMVVCRKSICVSPVAQTLKTRKGHCSIYPGSGL